MAETHRESPQSDRPGAENRPTRKPRRRWMRPQIEDYGSTRHLVRGSTGPLGDPGTPIGKRPL